jgi:preprotein translocase subunit SecD
VARGRVVLLSALVVVVAGAGLALGWGGHRFWRKARDPMGALGGVQLVYAVDAEQAWKPGPSSADLLRRTVDCLSRRAADANPAAIVRASGRRIEVLLPAVARALPVDITKRQLSRSGRLEFKLVDDGSRMMDELVVRLLDEPQPGTSSDAEYWTEPPGGADRHDEFLIADSREHLEAAIRALTAHRPLAADHEVRLEHRASDWRSYYVFRDVYLDNEDVQAADVAMRANGIPGVALELTDGGGQKFEALTKRVTGHKVAIVFEGTVVSAPVITGTAGRRVSIALGAYEDPAALVNQATDLVAMLRMPGIPAPVVLIGEIAVPPTP